MKKIDKEYSNNKRRQKGQNTILRRREERVELKNHVNLTAKKLVYQLS